MPNQDLLETSTPHRGSVTTVSRNEDAHAEALAQLLLWLIPAMAFLMAILSIR
jgi:hypothetical protein